MKKILSFFILIAISVSLMACGNNAYDDLSKKEKKFFDAFVEAAFNYFYNPSEARIQQVAKYRELDSGKVASYVKVQGTNRLGGTTSNWYFLSYSDSMNSYCLNEPYSTPDASDGDLSVSKLNLALAEHWESLGF